MTRSRSLTLVAGWMFALVLSGCAGSSYVSDAQDAEQAGRFDQAVALYTKALAEKPGDRHIEQNPQEAKWVKRIFELKISGHTLQEIATFLDRQ